MNGDIGIGKIIEQERHRDAIHIAVAPMEATEKLAPGQRVGVPESGKIGKASPHVGIVDPFLERNVQPGQKCYVFLFPGSITSLRHEWTHSAFDNVAPPSPADASRRWIETFAAKIDQTYNRVMEAAELYLDHQDYTYDNSEAYKDSYSQFGEFWKHYEVVTGKKVPDEIKEDCFFTCSC